jgi:hypothetical protein
MNFICRFNFSLWLLTFNRAIFSNKTHGRLFWLRFDLIGIAKRVMGGMAGANTGQAILPQLLGFFSVLFGAISIKSG